MITYFYPISSKNPYISNVQKCIKDNGYEIKDIKEYFKKDKSNEKTIVNLNWFDNLPNCNRLKAPIIFVSKILRIYFFSKKLTIVYTFHNSIAHDTKYPILNKYLVMYLCKKATIIVCLCSYTKEVLKLYMSEKEIIKKTRIIALPNYIDQFKIVENHNNSHILKVLFFGLVRKYKNVELIIEAARRLIDYPIEFIIAGEPENEDYGNSLLSEAVTLKNIKFRLENIPDSEVSQLFGYSDIVAIPLDLRSSLNSSTVILAMSLGKTVICPAIGTIHDFPSDLIYSYTYSKEEEHINKFIDSIMKVYSQWKANPEILQNKGMKLYDIVQKENSIRTLSQKYGVLYKELLH